MRTQRGRTFDSAAGTYARSRPGYPEDAVTWLTGAGSQQVLELGAGTGKLTVSLLALGHRVVATEPSARMVARLSGTLEVPTLRCGGEQLPFADDSFDVVAIGQALHWFDTSKAVPELARVLRRGGRLGMVWNFRDEREPWVRRLSGIIGAENFGPSQPRGIDWLNSTELAGSGLFGPIVARDFAFGQDVDREGLLDLVASRSYIIALPEAERADVLAEVGLLYDREAAGGRGLRLPYVTEAYATERM